MSSIDIRIIGITELDTDCIVNAANSHLAAGSGVCGAIFNAAGYSELQAACDEIGGCPTGSAVITPGFALKAKYIVHAVGPIWHDGNHHEPQDLYSCYRESLDRAKENDCHSIGFPLISAGIFGYPKDKAWSKALQSCNDWINENPGYDIDIVFAVLDQKIYDLGIETMKALGIDCYTVDLEESQTGMYAVLIPLVKTESGDALLLEVRSEKVRQPGEVCFPGGRSECEETPVETAVRETCEELGIRPEDIEVISEHASLIMGDGREIHPIKARLCIDGIDGLRLSEDEVAEVFLLPIYWLKENPPVHYDLSVMTDDELPDKLLGYLSHYGNYRDHGETDWLEYEGHGIWGLTARILMSYANKRMTETEKMLAGQLYDPTDDEIMREQASWQAKLWELNRLRPDQTDEIDAYMHEVFAECGDNNYIQLPFHANWGGHHVHFGSHIYANFNLTCVDDGHIYVGDWTKFGPNVTIATAGHPLEPELRKDPCLQYNKDVHIGSNVWIGAGAIIVPGVSIGDNTVIGAGSVVTKDIPANVVAYGNPCRVAKQL